MPERSFATGKAKRNHAVNRDFAIFTFNFAIFREMNALNSSYCLSNRVFAVFKLETEQGISQNCQLLWDYPRHLLWDSTTREECLRFRQMEAMQSSCRWARTETGEI